MVLIEELKEKSGDPAAPLAPELIVQAQEQAMLETLSEEQRSSSELVDALRKATSEAANRAPAEARALTAQESALLSKLTAAQPNAPAKVLEILMYDSVVSESLRDLDAVRVKDADDARKLAAKNKRKKEEQAAEQAAEDAAEQEAIEAAAAKAAEQLAAQEAKAAEAAAASVAQVNAALGADAAREFAEMLKHVSEAQAGQDMAISRAADKQSDAMMAKLLKGQSGWQLLVRDSHERAG